MDREIQDIKRRAGITTEQLQDPTSDQWMQNERERSIGLDFTAARTALQKLDDAMRSIEEAEDSFTGQEKEQLKKAMKLIGPGIATIRRLLERLT